MAEYAAWYFGLVFTPVSFLRVLRAPKKRTFENVLVLTSQDDFHETRRTREKGKMLNEGLETKRLSASTVSTKLSQALKTFRFPKHGVVSERIERDCAISSTCKKKTHHLGNKWTSGKTSKLCHELEHGQSMPTSTSRMRVSITASFEADKKCRTKRAPTSGVVEPPSVAQTSQSAAQRIPLKERTVQIADAGLDEATRRLPYHPRLLLLLLQLFLPLPHLLHVLLLVGRPRALQQEGEPDKPGLAGIYEPHLRRGFLRDSPPLSGRGGFCYVKLRASHAILPRKPSPL